MSTAIGRPAATHEGAADESDALLRMMADLDAGEAHGLIPRGCVGRMLLDVASPLSTIGAVVVALDLDEHAIGPISPVGDPEQSALHAADLRVQFRLGKTRVDSVQAHVGLERR